MVLVNVITFAVFKTLNNLVSMQKSLFAKNNCWSKQNYKKCPMWPNLYFFAHSETGSRFVKIRLKLEIKFIQSVFIYSRNTNLKIYKNEKIVNRNKTDQIRAQKKIIIIIIMIIMMIIIIIIFSKQWFAFSEQRSLSKTIQSPFTKIENM